MNIANTHNEGVGDWISLWRELDRRTRQPWKHGPLVMYVVVALVGLGGLGIWVEAVKFILSEEPESYDGIFTAVVTFYPALIGSASFQLLLIATGNVDRTMTAFSVLVLMISVGSALLLSVFHDRYPTVCLLSAIPLAIFSIWLWSITNVDNPIYKTLPIDTPSGGSPFRDLKGDISTFEAD